MDALPNPHFTTIETSTRPPLAPIVRAAFEAALLQRSKVNQAVFAIQGCTSRRIQMFSTT